MRPWIRLSRSWVLGFCTAIYLPFEPALDVLRTGQTIFHCRSLRTRRNSRLVADCDFRVRVIAVDALQREDTPGGGGPRHPPSGSAKLTAALPARCDRGRRLCAANPFSRPIRAWSGGENRIDLTAAFGHVPSLSNT